MKIGLISDTHGRLDPALWELFEDVDAIIHAGDWDDYSLATVLSTIAPVHGIRGNVDPPTRRFPELLKTKIGRLTVYVTHIFDTSSASLNSFVYRNPGVQLVVFGHTHRVFIEQVGDAVVVNPGSATRPRGGPPSVGIATIENKALRSVTIHDLATAEYPVIARYDADETQNTPCLGRQHR